MLKNSNIKILLVEDDKRLAELTAEYLKGHGLQVEQLADGSKVVGRLAERQFDVVYLDLNLPGMDGVEVCRKIRERSALPIIMVTARDELPDRVVGLDAGADDYLGKPFNSRELLSRIQAVVRRARGAVGPDKTELNVGELRLLPNQLKIYLGGEAIDSTAHEFAILYALAKHPGRVLSREQLLGLVKGNADESFDRSVDVHISRLRQKLGDDARKPKILKTIRGAGYMLTVGE